MVGVLWLVTTRFAIIAACALVLVAAGPLPAHAADRTFTGAASSSWTEPGNWSPPGVPGADDRAVVPASAAVAVTGDSAVRVRELDLGRGASAAGGFAPITITGRARLDDGARLTYARLDGRGTVLRARGAADLSRVSGPGTVVAHGTLRALPLLTSGRVILRGRAAVLDGSTGRVALAGRGTRLDVPFGLRTSAPLRVPRGARLVLDRAAVLAAPQLRIDRGGHVDAQADAGAIAGDVVNSGRLCMGFTRGGARGERTLRVTGSYRQTSAGELCATAGRAFGAASDQLALLVVDGVARLAGTVQVRGLADARTLARPVALVRARRIAGRFERLRGVAHAGLRLGRSGREIRLARRR